MGAKVYCLASAKGGSGKTIIAASLAGFLCRVGKKCAIVDCDAATYGMTLLYIVEVAARSGDGKRGVFDLTYAPNGNDDIADGIVTLNNGVDLMPATYRFSSRLDPEEDIQADVLPRVVEVMRPNYDLIFLDAQAGSDRYSRLSMNRSLSDEVIIVSEYDPLSAAGVERLKRVADGDLDYDRTWILLNKMLPEFVAKFSEFLSVAQYLPPIPWNAEVVKSYAERKTALDLERGNEYTLAIKRTIEALLGDYIRNDLDAWAEERADALKAPLDEQCQRAESELELALGAKRDLERRNRMRILLQIYPVVAVVTGVPFVLAYSDVGFYFGDVTLLMVVMLALFGFPWALLNLWGRSKSPESARNDRLIRRLEEKLQRLEALRAAKFETMVRGMNPRGGDTSSS